MIEPARAIAWTIDTLKASSTFMAAVPGGVHEGVADADTPYPHCVVNVQSPGDDVMGVAGARKMAEPLIQVAVWGLAENGWNALIIAADAADAVLHQARHGISPSSDAEVISSLRNQAVIRTVVENGVKYSVLGGLYRQQVRSLS